MKKTRFSAACSGLVEKAKSAIRRSMVENALKSNELEVEARLYALDDKKNQLVKTLATGDSNCIKSALQEMADLLQEEKALKVSKELSGEILAVLDEEIEVEESK